MTERGRSALFRDAAQLRVGPSAVSWDDAGLTLRFDEVSLPWPGTHWLPRRVRGRITFRPSFVTDTAHTLDEAGAHRWWPIAPCGEVAVTCEGEPSHNWRGHGYLDSNWGDTGLEQRFVRWDWARARTRDGGAMILYDSRTLEGGTNRLGLRFAPDGARKRFEPPKSKPLRHGVWCVARSIPCDPGQSPRTVRMLEDGPFYARAIVESEIAGTGAPFIHESFDGRRFASAIVRGMLPFRMPRRSGRSR